MVDVISPNLRVVSLLPPERQLIADAVRERLRFSISETKGNIILIKSYDRVAKDVNDSKGVSSTREFQRTLANSSLKMLFHYNKTMR